MRDMSKTAKLLQLNVFQTSWGPTTCWGQSTPSPCLSEDLPCAWQRSRLQSAFEHMTNHRQTCHSQTNVYIHTCMHTCTHTHRHLVHANIGLWLGDTWSHQTFHVFSQSCVSESSSKSLEASTSQDPSSKFSVIAKASLCCPAHFISCAFMLLGLNAFSTGLPCHRKTWWVQVTSS